MTDNAFISTRPVFNVDGQERPELGEALTGMVVNLPLNGCAHAELHVTNWGLEQGGREPDFLFTDIGLGSAIEVLMPQAEEAVPLFKGEVTGLEERYGEGAPALVLLLQDKLHRLGRTRHSRSFEEQSPDDIIRSIAGEAGLQADTNASSITGSWHQINESDLAFLMRLTGRFDIAIRLEEDTLRARPEEPDSQPVQLDAQDSALQIRLLADLNHQPSRSRVLGYNPDAAQETDYEATALSPAPAGITAADTLNQLGWPGAEIVPQPFAQTSAEAEAYAKAHFHRMGKRFVYGDITCQGEAALRSGREIELAGVSPRLCGTYQVVHCVHRFDNTTGFDTHLKVHRPDWRS